MPWHQEPMKDVVTDDTPRGAGNELRSEDFRMGKPSASNVALLPPEYIGRVEGTRGTETSKYPEEEILP